MRTSKRRAMTMTAALLASAVVLGCGTTVRQQGAGKPGRSASADLGTKAPAPGEAAAVDPADGDAPVVAGDPAAPATETQGENNPQPQTGTTAGGSPVPLPVAAVPVRRPGNTPLTRARGKPRPGASAKSSTSNRPGRPVTSPAGSTGVVSAATGVLKVGVAVPAADASSSLTGAPGATDYPGIAKALVADINAHGGIAGRQVSLDIATVASANDYDGATAEQDKACTALTEDAHDTVVLSTDAGASYGTQCYIDHKTPLLVDKHLLDVPGIAAGSPWLLPSASANYTNTARALPIALKAQGYLSGKIATVAYDLPALRGAVTNTLIPGLKQAGGNVVDSVFLPPSFEAAPQAIASDVLRFRQEGVDHVVFLSGLWPLFAVQAQSQAYFPRYAITTEDLPKYSYDGFHVPAQQAQGLVGIGWVPAEDLTGSGVTPLSSQERTCLDIINRNANLNYVDRGNGNYFNGLDLCEVFRELKAALDPASGKPIAPGDIAGLVASTPSSYQSTLTPNASFRPGGTDYTGGYQWLAFGSDCSCFRYTSGVKAFLR